MLSKCKPVHRFFMPLLTPQGPLKVPVATLVEATVWVIKWLIVSSFCLITVHRSQRRIWGTVWNNPHIPEQHPTVFMEANWDDTHTRILANLTNYIKILLKDCQSKLKIVDFPPPPGPKVSQINHDLGLTDPSERRDNLVINDKISLHLFVSFPAILSNKFTI